MLLRRASFLLFATAVSCTNTAAEIPREHIEGQHYHDRAHLPRDFDHVVVEENAISLGEVSNVWTGEHPHTILSVHITHDAREDVVKRAVIPDVYLTDLEENPSHPIVNSIENGPKPTGSRSHSYSHSHSHSHSHTYTNTRLVHTTIKYLSGLPSSGAKIDSSSDDVPVRSVMGTPSKGAYSVTNSPAPLKRDQDDAVNDGDDLEKRTTEVFAYVYDSTTSLATAKGTFPTGAAVYPSKTTKTPRRKKTKTKTRVRSTSSMFV